MKVFFRAISPLMYFAFSAINNLLGHRKLLLFLYSITFLGRTTIAFTANFCGFILGRSLEHIGNSASSASLNNLLTKTSSKEINRRDFSLIHSLGQLGPIIGGITTAYLMHHFGCSFKAIFTFSLIFSFLILYIIGFKVKEIPFEKESTKKHFQWKEMKKLDLSFILLMVIHFIFSLGRCSEAFMGLYAINHFNLSYENVPYIIVFFNVSWTCFSYLINPLTEYIERFTVLAFGISALILADILFLMLKLFFKLP